MSIPRAIPPALGRLTLLVLGVAIVGSLAIVAGLVLGGAGAAIAPTSPGEGTETARVNGSVDGGPAPALAQVGPDADGDGLSDEYERRLGTDLDDPDTDGDGYPDGMEATCEDRLPGADPLRQDAYVEVDTTAGTSFALDARWRLQRAFATAPIENPNGEEGIDLHLVDSDDDLLQADVVGNREGNDTYDDIGDYRDAHFDHEGAGYYYLLVVSNASYEGNPSYAGAGYNGTALIEAHDDALTMSTLVMHELGHAFGIGHGWEGVDSRNYSVAEYRSVMNYNGLYQVLDYSDGSGEVGRNEWAFVAEDRYRPEMECGDEGCLAGCV